MRGLLTHRMVRWGAVWCVLVGLLGAGMVWGVPVVGKDHRVNVEKGTRFSALQKKIQPSGIKNPAILMLLFRLFGYDRHMFAGSYQLKKGMSYFQVLQVFKRGLQTPIRVVLHHASNQADLARQLTRNLEMRASDFEALFQDQALLQSYGFTKDNVLALFIPNTYEVYWTTTPKRLLACMHRSYQRFWNQSRRKKAAQIQLTPIEVSILASIVQKETAHMEEAPRIAGVYLNRLRRNHLLQACPTLLYALNRPGLKRVLKKHLSIDSPYNTYRYKGLTPGPICLPSMAMIDAVLQPQKHNYLYFSAKEDFSGRHYFSKSFSQHLNYARRYQRALNRARIFK